ncbi:MAG: hypothetical protein N2321_03710 [Melioribacteraceae bacterium]|nr:hypothetical protein [Melioribacteraceae bacterium]
MTEFFEYSNLISKALKTFENIHGSSDGIYAFVSPANLMILGDHTHYNDGILISARVNKFWTCIIRKRKDKNISFANSETGKFISSCLDNQNVNEHQEFKVLLELTRIMCSNNIINNGFDCVIEGNIPECFGLGKISSLQIAFINGIKKIHNVQIDDEELLKLVHENEKNLIGKISNRGHHYGIQFGKANKLFSYDLRNKDFQNVNFLPKTFELIVCDTENIIENSNLRCNERVEECEIGVKNLRLYIWGIKNLRDVESDFLLRHYHMLPRKIFNKVLYNVNERKRCQDALNYIKNNNLEDFGTLIKSSHWSLSQDYEVSDKYVDFLVEEASKIKGVLASKMISCSNISSTFNIVESTEADNFSDKISENYKSAFGKELKIYRLKITDGVKKISIKK